MQPTARIVLFLCIVAVAACTVFTPFTREQQYTAVRQHRSHLNDSRDNTEKSGSTVEATNDLVEVFMISHTHDDVGWLISVDQYYIQQVQWILDSCIRQLLDNPQRKFTYVEQAYFQRWWRGLTPSQKDDVRLVIKRGQLEFNLGGITMNDEAITTFYEEINQMTEGAFFIQREFGKDVIPRSAWHIDPFGHSASTALLWNQIGFPGFVLNRIPEWLKLQKRSDKNLEFIWRPSSKSYPGNSSDILIHVLDTWYSSPGSCAFNDNNGWNGIWVQDDPAIFNMNIKQIADNFAKTVRNRSAWYRHNKLLIPFGDDFAHYEAFNSFINMDKLIDYMNANVQTYNITVKYSFLSEYFAAIQKLNINWSVYTDRDFFPYNDGPQSFWSGYYTSRPAIKNAVRRADSLLQTTETLFTLSRAVNPTQNNTFQNAYSSLIVIREGTTIATHHDAITGTEKAAVEEDYFARLNNGSLASNYLNPLLFETYYKPATGSSNSNIVLGVWNPLGWERSEFCEFITNSFITSVVNNNSPGSKLPMDILSIPTWSTDFTKGKYRVFFYCRIPALSGATFTLSTTNTESEIKVAAVHEGVKYVPALDNGNIRLSFDQQTNRINEITNVPLSYSTNFNQNLVQYFPASSQEGQASGAYIFRPSTFSLVNVGSQSSCPNPCSATKQVQLSLIPGVPVPQHVFTTIKGQQYNDTFASTFRGVAGSELTFNIRRVDGNTKNAQTWDQDVQVDFLALPLQPQNPLYTLTQDTNTFQVADVTVGPSPTKNGVTVHINFKQPMTSQPVLIIEVRNTQLTDDTFTTVTSAVSRTGADVLIYRITGGADGGWRDSLILSYLAIVPTSANSQWIKTGSLSVPSSWPKLNEINFHYRIATASSPQGFWGNPLVLANARTTTPSILPPFALTNNYIDSYTLGINVVALNDTHEFKTSNNLFVDYVLLARYPLQETVRKETDQIATNVVKGSFVTEVQQLWETGYGQITRIFSDQNKNFLGPLIKNKVEIVEEINAITMGRELVTRFTTSINNNHQMKTDDNALLLMHRTFNWTTTEVIAGNYFPMTGRSILSNNQNYSISVLSDSTHGVGLLPQEGAFEIMLERRCVSDDGRGVGEVLNSSRPLQNKLWVSLDNSTNTAIFQRNGFLLQNFAMSPVVLRNSLDWGRVQSRVSIEALPANIHLLSFQTMNGSAEEFVTILRLQHIFEAGEHPVLSQNVSVDLNRVLKNWRVVGLDEANLTGNVVKKLEGKQSKEGALPVVSFHAMQIRTFLIRSLSGL